MRSLFLFFCFPWLELIFTKRQSRYSNSQNHWDIPLQDDKQRADLVCTYYLLSKFWNIHIMDLVD